MCGFIVAFSLWTNNRFVFSVASFQILTVVYEISRSLTKCVRKCYWMNFVANYNNITNSKVQFPNSATTTTTEKKDSNTHDIEIKNGKLLRHLWKNQDWILYYFRNLNSRLHNDYTQIYSNWTLLPHNLFVFEFNWILTNSLQTKEINAIFMPFNTCRSVYTYI